MKNRQLKKNSKTAMRFLIQLKHCHLEEFQKADVFDAAHHKVPRNTMLRWFKTTYWDDEWESEPAYFALNELVWWHFADVDFSGDREVWHHEPDISTVKKVFDLAEEIIRSSVSD